MHHSPSALGSTYTGSPATVAPPPADLDSRGGGWRLYLQNCHHQVQFGGGSHLCTFLTFEVPHKQTPTQQYSQITHKQIQQSKCLWGGLDSRKIRGGLGIQVHREVNMMWRGSSDHIFAYLGLLSHHSMPQSTKYNSPIWGGVNYRGKCSNNYRICLEWCVNNTNAMKDKSKPTGSVGYPSKLKSIESSKDKISTQIMYNNN